MKYNNKAYSAKNAVAAILLGSLVYAPSAFAKLGPKEGLNLDDLKRVTRDAKFSMEGRTLVLKGLLPRRCLAPAPRMERMGAADGKHLVMIRMPGCENNLDLQDNDDLVAFELKKELDDVSGKVFLRHFKADTHIGTSERNADEEIAGKQVKSSEELAQEAAEAAERVRLAKLKKLENDVAQLCRKGDHVGIGNELQKAQDILGDISELLEKNNEKFREKFKRDLAEARDAEEAKAILERYIEAADQYGWDSEALNASYLDRRFNILTRNVEDLKMDKELKSSSVAKEIESWRREMREMDRDIYRRRVKDVAFLYGELGALEANRKNFAAARGHLERAKAFASEADAKLVDAAIAKIYGEEFGDAQKAVEACIKKNPKKMVECESKFKEQADNIQEAMKGKAESSDEAMEEYMAFQEQYIQALGAGPSYYMMGYGRHTPYMPGALEYYKQQSIQEMYQRMMMGGNRGLAGRGSLF